MFHYTDNLLNFLNHLWVPVNMYVLLARLEKLKGFFLFTHIVLQFWD